MTDKITAICQECGKQFEYVLKPGFPRKYCFECSEAKKASFEAKQPNETEKIVFEGIPVERPMDRVKKAQNGSNGAIYTSYAKDVFCALFDRELYKDMDFDNLMTTAINLVKQAKEAFE